MYSKFEYKMCCIFLDILHQKHTPICKFTIFWGFKKDRLNQQSSTIAEKHDIFTKRY